MKVVIRNFFQTLREKARLHEKVEAKLRNVFVRIHGKPEQELGNAIQFILANRRSTIIRALMYMQDC